MNSFTDDDLKRLKESLEHYPTWAEEQRAEYWKALFARLEAAEQQRDILQARIDKLDLCFDDKPHVYCENDSDCCRCGC